MKSILVSRPLLLALIATLTLFLAACERPLQDEGEPEESSTPTVRSTVLDEEVDEPSHDLLDDVFPSTSEQEPGDLLDAYPAAPEADQVEPAETEQSTSHTVQTGESLFTVAQQYNVSLDDLAATNNLDPNSLLSPGMMLLLPIVEASALESVSGSVPGGADDRVHIVQAGENLYRIGLVYGFTVEELASYNNLENPDWLDIGQEIRIPPDQTP